MYRTLSSLHGGRPAIIGRGLCARKLSSLVPLRRLPKHITISGVNMRPKRCVVHGRRDYCSQTTPAKLPPSLLRADYKPPAFLVPRVQLEFDLDPVETVVTSSIEFAVNPAAQSSKSGAGTDVSDPGRFDRDLELDGNDGISLHSIRINGANVLDEVTIANEKLTIPAAVLQRCATNVAASHYHRKNSGAVGDGVIQLETVSSIRPEDNSSGSGLYVDGGGSFMTQCEANGFRKIAFFPDRPDVLSLYDRVTLRGNAARFPVMLSNGNVVSEAMDGDRRTVVWSDPHPKPCYLFALVAGDLQHIRSDYVTLSGRSVELLLWSEPKDLSALEFAMTSLKQSMEWDEQRYGLEYDLDRFNIVATDFFNMGAMENKSLNVFNTSYLVGDSQRSTDGDLENIARVVAHEYFHNWTGNRVTCRDWFQLTLKEGLTVFRDQQFSADVVSSPGVQRIDEVIALHTHQFKEDSSGMAHPIRPESVVVQDNFYTTTVYEKGAEVVRMTHCLLGEATFRQGMDDYFAAFDGQAVTCDDFRLTMAAAAAKHGKTDVATLLRTSFERWYDQSGTPEVHVSVGWNPAENGTAVLRFSQCCGPSSPGGSSAEDDSSNDNINNNDQKAPFVIPVRLGFFDAVTGLDIGTDANGMLQRAESDSGREVLLVDGNVAVIHDATGELRLKGIPEAAVPSLLRGFSAPVKLTTDVSYDVALPTDLDSHFATSSVSTPSGVESDTADQRGARLLTACMAADRDPVNRYLAAQQLIYGVVRKFYAQRRAMNAAGGGDEQVAATVNGNGGRGGDDNMEGDGLFFELFERVLGDESIDPALRAQILSVPTFSTLVTQVLGPSVNPLHACSSVDDLRETVVDRFAGRLLEQYAAHAAAGPDTNIEYEFSVEAVSRRRFANFCLGMLACMAPADGFEVTDGGLRSEVLALCQEQFDRADNMTDRLCALQALGRLDSTAFADASDVFLASEPTENALKWLQVQATCSLPGALERLTGSVMASDCYDSLNPNKIRAVVGGFVRSNPRHFHATDGSGYRFLRDQIVDLDPHNSQVAAGLTKVLLDWHYYDTATQAKFKSELRVIADTDGISVDVAEVVASALRA